MRTQPPGSVNSWNHLKIGGFLENLKLSDIFSKLSFL